jgi:hypothetical protein
VKSCVFYLCDKKIILNHKHSLYVKGSGAAAVQDRIKAAKKNFAELINP